METFITVIHVLTAIFMIIVVLIQGGNTGGVGAAFGSGNTQGVFGAGGATSFLGKLTYGMAGVFMMTSITLSVMQGRSGETGLKQRLEKKGSATTTAPAPEAAPSTQPAANGNAAPQAPAGEEKAQ